MGCAPSRVDPTAQFKLMRLAQSKGLFLSSDMACSAIRDSPNVPPEELLEQLEHSLRPRAVPVTRDPRAMSNEQRRTIAAAIADAATADSQSSHPKPLPASHIDAVTPAFLPSEIPEGLRLRDGAEEELCVICTAPLLDADGAEHKGGLLIRQLPCSHAFHACCVDVWLTEQAGLCPLCLDPYPRPEFESHASHAYEAFQQRMANGGREELEQYQREERERLAEAERRDRELVAYRDRYMIAAMV